MLETARGRPRDVNVAAGLGIFPAEIWHIVCDHLHGDQQALVNLRLTSKDLSLISAEFLISEVCIHTDLESFTRLKLIAEHESLRKGITKLIYEAALLDKVCIHSFVRHYELEHHSAEKPSEPIEKTDRSQRLHARNLAKHEEMIQERYHRYQYLFLEQQDLVEKMSSRSSEAIMLLRHIENLPNLKEIVLRTDFSCPHMVSTKFREKYISDCATPISINSSQTIWQLEQVLKAGLDTLSARCISPGLFDGKGGRTAEWLSSIFSELKNISLMFRLESEVELSPSDDGLMLKDSKLAFALAYSKNLNTLTVNFQPGPNLERGVANLTDILPCKTFSQLRILDLDFILSTENQLLDVLKAQPMLAYLDLAFMTLTAGDWASTVRRMRSELNLRSFVTGGLLEDAQRTFSVALFSKMQWEDGEKCSLRAELDLFVTDSSYPVTIEEYLQDNPEEGEADYDMMWNPVNRIENDFMEEEELEYEYGPIDDDDDDIDDSDDDNDKTSSTADDSEDEDNSEYHSAEDMPKLIEDPTAMDVD